MNDTNAVLRNIMVHSILKARMLDSPNELDSLIHETVKKLIRAFHVQDQLLSEKQVSDRYRFLNVIQLRNMRSRGTGPRYLKLGRHRNSRVYYRFSDLESWIVKHYQLESFVNECDPSRTRSKDTGMP